ncbi:30S ribosomal protein S15 [Patescibacteria group bacterium]|nr:30S ribosomal protein S15 [Patescibacteria group bacterium]
MLDKKTKEKVIKKYRVHDTDTGSPQVQIAILTEEIKQLTEHLKQHKHDYSSRRGLLKKVSERRKLLKYLQKENSDQFKELAEKLKLRIAQKLQAEEDEEKAKEKKYIVASEDEDETLEVDPKEAEDKK